MRSASSSPLLAAGCVTKHIQGSLARGQPDYVAVSDKIWSRIIFRRPFPSRIRILVHVLIAQVSHLGGADVVGVHAAAAAAAAAATAVAAAVYATDVDAAGVRILIFFLIFVLLLFVLSVCFVFLLLLRTSVLSCSLQGEKSETRDYQP